MRCAAHPRADRLVVVVDLEGAEAELADVDGRRGVPAAALPALQSLHSLHGLSIGRGFEPRNELPGPDWPRPDHRSSHNDFVYLTLADAHCQRDAVSSPPVARAWLPFALLAAYALAFGWRALGGGLLVFDDHPGQFYRLSHAITLGLAPWRFDPGWWAGYAELQFYPPGFAWLGALLYWITGGSLSAVYGLPGAALAGVAASRRRGLRPAPAAGRGAVARAARRAGGAHPVRGMPERRRGRPALGTDRRAPRLGHALRAGPRPRALGRRRRAPAARSRHARGRGHALPSRPHAHRGRDDRARRGVPARRVGAACAKGSASPRSGLGLAGVWLLPLLAHLDTALPLAWQDRSLPVLGCRVHLAAGAPGAGRARRAWRWRGPAGPRAMAARLAPLSRRWCCSMRSSRSLSVPRGCPRPRGGRAPLGARGRRRARVAAMAAASRGPAGGGGRAGRLRAARLGRRTSPASRCGHGRPVAEGAGDHARASAGRALARAPDGAAGRVLFVRSGVSLDWRPEWWRPHTHIGALTPMRAGRAIVGGRSRTRRRWRA